MFRPMRQRKLGEDMARPAISTVTHRRVSLELFFGFELKSLQGGKDAEHRFLFLPGWHVHVDAVIGLVIADADLDCLPAAVGSLDQVLEDVLVGALGLCVTLYGETGRAGRSPVASGEIVLYRSKAANRACGTLSERMAAKYREKKDHNKADAQHLRDPLFRRCRAHYAGCFVSTVSCAAKAGPSHLLARR